MKSCICLLLFLAPIAGCLGQDFHGFSIDGPSFPSSSERAARDLTIPSVAPSVGAVPYAHPVPGVAPVNLPGTLLPKVKGPVLLEFKNHTLESALAYDLNGKALRYVDLMNVTRTVPANQIDWPATAKLNHLRRMPDHRM
jgi:hypothetical protein